MIRCLRNAVGLVVCVGLAACGTPQPERTQAGAQAGAASANDSRRPFTRKEIEAFKADVAKAEQIPDLTDRCLAYPDPPGSHWSRDAVIAYCHYRLQPTLDNAFVMDAFNRKHMGEVDGAVDELVKKNSDSVRAQEIIWRSMSDNFQGADQQLRLIADAWKQQAPRSALAHVASAMVYKAMASKARGENSASETAQGNFDAMHVLLERAKEDLAEAAALDPSLTSTYALMVNVGVLDSDAAYAAEGARRGLAVDPASFVVYDDLAMAVAPRWGGSRSLQEQLISSAQAQAAKNPLLLTIRANVLVDIYDLRTCSCQTVQEQVAYRDAFDQVATARDLLNAGGNAKRNHQPELAYIYLSEALRFYPDESLSEDRQAALAELAQVASFHGQ
jgi:tetratricopeptide (TPR) repeat protein